MITSADIKLGKMLQQKRKEMGYTQIDMAIYFGFTSPVFFSLVESGKSKLPASRVKLISTKLNISPKKIEKLLIESAKEEIKYQINSSN